MFTKTAALAVLALAASVAAQTPSDHIFFTNPVGDDRQYQAGANETFSWQTACVAPSSLISSTPTKAAVQLMNADDSDMAFFLEDITTIDCSKNSGNNYWVVPDKYSSTTLLSLKIALDEGSAYSGKFTIKGGKATPTTAPDADKPASGASIVAPVLSGAAAAVAAAALLL
ncbi:hypothetical protein BG011_003100 [Mortierella polycephala]|uniref:Uncharacterized protein n=1 Tax=Mortierella polycephala TaxID=41804 RepID=A0A9P6Q5W1_9FUNG|nr:hypothetical protein BG011_003100 [Mortierella polycephala]